VSDGAGRGLSPAVRAFIALDVVLVLVFVVVLLVNRSDAGEEPATAATTTSETTAASPSTGSSGETTTPSGEESTGEETGDPESESARLFASPSGNIMCSITEDGASCSIAELAEEGLVEDESCDGTVGHVVRVSAEGGAERPCVEGKGPGKAPAATPELAYEDSTSAFGYTCTSSRSGIICRHDESGHGFSIARAGSSLF